MTAPAGAPRRAGRPAKISRDLIVATATEIAREHGLDAVTMVELGQRLNVAPGNLNYHIGDRQQLLDIVAPFVVEFTLDPAWMPDEDADWQVWLRAWAVELRRLLLAQPRMVSFFRAPTHDDHSADQFDRLCGVLFAAGMDATQVSRVTTLIGQLVFISVRDELAATNGIHPQDAEIARSLASNPAALPHLRALASAEGHRDPDAQFAFDLDCALAGVTSVLSLKPRSRSRFRREARGDLS